MASASRPAPPSVTIVLIGSDLLFGSRIADAVTRAGATFLRIDDPTSLPPRQAVDLVLVDWADRRPGWGAALRSWATEDLPGRQAHRLILAFGPHRDLEAHAAARVEGIGPMLARSRVLEVLEARLARPHALGR